MDMRKLVLPFAFCMAGVMALSAQNVDKSLVSAKVDETAKAAEELKKLDTAGKKWHFTGVVGTNAAATGLVNWSAGGKNNVNGVAFAKLRLLWKKDNFAWDTNLDTEYGLSWIDQDEDPFQKSSDKINLSTKFGWEFSKSWYLTVLGGFQSQYATGFEYKTGYNPVISRWLAPAYTDFSVGIDWKPNSIFSVYISPVAGRVTTVNIPDEFNRKYTDEFKKENPGEEYANFDYRTHLQDKYGTYVHASDGSKEYRNSKAEFGLTFKGGINYKYKELTVITTLGLFTPYAWNKTPVDDPYFKYCDNNRRFGNFDVDWDLAVSYQLLKVLNVTFSTSLKYYNGVLIDRENTYAAERVQFKSVLGLGVGYSF